MINTKKVLFSILTLSLLSLTGCTKDGDYELNSVKKTIFHEEFTDATDNTTLDTALWANVAQTGTKKWTEQVYSGNGYAEFSSYGSGQAVNVGWLISPPIDMDKQQGEKLVFQAAQNFLKSADNSLELMVSTDYDGTNFSSASWEKLDAIVPTPETEKYLFINSGEIDLSEYTGTLYFAFRVRGSGTNTNLTGTYQIDNIRIFY